MVTVDERLELLERLRPWLRILRERTFPSGHYDLHQVSPTDTVWLRLPATWEVDNRVFEGLELLAIVGAVDYELWRLALSVAAAGRTLRVEDHAAEGTICKLGCVLSFTGFDEFPNVLTAWAGRVVTGADPDTASDEYVYVRDWLASLYATSGHDSDAVQIPVKIWLHEGSFEERMEQLAHVASLHSHSTNSLPRTSSENAWPSLFQIIEIDPGTPDAVTANAFSSMVSIVRRGIFIELFKPHGMDVTEATAALFADGLQQLFGLSDEENGSGVTVVELPVYLPPRTVTALYSALHSSRSVLSLTINSALVPWQPDPDDAPTLTRDERDHLWRWIAFAVFAPHATHCLQEVKMDVAKLSFDDVRALREQLEHPNQVPVYPAQSSSSSPGVTGSTVISTYRSRRPDGASEDSASEGTFLHAAPGKALVVGASERASCQQVLVPGFGLAWAKADTEISEAPVRQGCVDRLSLNYIARQSRDPVMSLLNVVGHGLTTVSVFRILDDSRLDDWARAVLQACPRLETFAVYSSLKMQSMDVFVDVLSHDSCRIERLELHCLHVADVRSVERFFRWLTRLSSSRLRFLQLNVSGLNDLETSNEVVEALGAVLDTNSTLCQLNVQLSHHPRVRTRPDLWNAVKNLNTIHNLEPICVCRAPLALDQKLAFLSVLSSGPSAGVDPETHEDNEFLRQLVRAMDRPLIAHVFSFAAECERRAVEVRLAVDDE